MHTEADISSLTRLVLALAFGGSVLFGAIVQRTNFCTMGAISDVVSMGSWTRARQWAMAVGVAMIGFGLLGASGLLRVDDTLYSGARWLWLSTLVGGAMFGFGMVLASGCGSKTLVRIGGGNLKGVVVFLAMAIASFATLRGITAVWRTQTVERVLWAFDGPATLGHIGARWIGMPPAQATLAVGGLLGAAMIAWALASAHARRPESLLAGVGVGGTVVAMWAISGWLGYVPDHPETLEPAYLATNSGRAEALTFTAPMAYAIDWLMFYSDRSKVLTIAVVSVVGVVCGAAVAALWSGRFRWEGFRSTEDLANHLLGGVLMGVGGVTAMGCTIGHGVSGLSVLSLNSFSAVAAIIVGAVAALRYQLWRMERAA